MTTQEKHTGADLLAVVQRLTPEQLEQPVWLMGCDCSGQWDGTLASMGGELILGRLD